VWQIDVCEPQELIDYFVKKGGKMERLEVGDYIFDSMVAFERKSDDFLNFSHMLSQIDELVDTFPFPFLVVEKSLSVLIMKSQEVYHKNMLPNILGTIASLSVRGCPPIFCDNQTMMLQIMEKLAEKSLDGKERGMKRMLRTQHLNEDDIAINVLRGFKVGMKKAEDIANKYDGDVRIIVDVLMNRPEELKEICGISDGTIDKIKANVNAKRTGGIKNGEAVDGKTQTEDPF
jgi:ERCC4-type nuclease